MKKRIDIDFVEDILDAITAIERYTQGMTREAFFEDDKTYNAVIRMLEIIGEASGKISIDIKEKHPQIPWRSIVGMRNKVIHEYFGVNLKVIWSTITLELPHFKSAILSIQSKLLEGEKL